MLLTTLSLPLILLMKFEFTICAIDYMKHLEIFKSYRAPLKFYKENREYAKKYIQENFKNFGLKVTNQDFETEIQSSGDLKKASGTNIIGTSQSSFNNSQVIIVGANYDSSLAWNPLMENGASMAALLVLAEEFQTRIKTGTQITTVLFVALDINIQSRGTTEGLQRSGADHFVIDYLNKYLDGKSFIGAIILDSISNYNLKNSSQTLWTGFNQTFPSAYNKLMSSGRKGDFIGLVTRQDPNNTAFAHHFSTSYRKLNSDYPFHLEELVFCEGCYLMNEVESKSEMPFFWQNLTAFLLTDMGPSRNLSNEQSCQINKICHDQTFWTDERKKFVQATTRAILDVLLYTFNSDVATLGSLGTVGQKLLISDTNNICNQMSICKTIVVASFFSLAYNLKLIP